MSTPGQWCSPAGEPRYHINITATGAVDREFIYLFIRHRALQRVSVIGACLRSWTFAVLVLDQVLGSGSGFLPPWLGCWMFLQGDSVAYLYKLADPFSYPHEFFKAHLFSVFWNPSG